MDCARAAARNEGVENVTLVYRRTREFMPAQREEQEAAIRDGVVFAELLAPVCFQDGVLVCEKQQLGGYDSSGRRGVTGSGEKTETCFDTVIGATGARVDTALFAKNGIRLSEKGFAVLNENNESSIENVYIAGDCRAGAATVVKAVADGKTAARDILRKLGIAPDFAADARINAARSNVDTETLYNRKGVLVPAVKEAADSSRCLGCDAVCEICADVCPNRANIAVTMENGRRQIVHIDRMCNECGNCAVFCPQAGYPYKEKFTVFSGSEDFEDSDNAGILWENGAVTLLRLADKKIAAYKKGDAALDKNFSGLIDVLVHKYEYLGG
jgi:putative selenate reductase